MAPQTGFDSRRYWRRTLTRILVLLGIWALVGPVMGVILVEPLNRITIGGVSLGFWIAHQGAIYVFVILIFVNAWLADRADREFDVHETEGTTQHVRAGH